MRCMFLIRDLKMLNRLVLDNDSDKDEDEGVDDLLIVMTIPVIHIILIVENIRNTCNTMLFCNYIFFIFHLLLSTYHLSILILVYSF
jgi:hypothetical protein